MSASRTTRMMQAALTALHRTGVAALLAPLARGKGVIFTLHNVRPEPGAAFEPNRVLKVTPEFLETTVETVRKAGYDIVSLDEAARRLQANELGKPFACFTFDDGYRDNRDFAYPVLKKHAVPFTIYVPADYADGKGDLWWFVLEHALAKADTLRIAIGGVEREFDLTTADAKSRAFDEIYWPLRAGSEDELRATVRRIADAVGYDSAPLCRDLIMDWDEIRALAADPLVTIGAHTCRHYAVAKLKDDEAKREIRDSVERIERELGRPCRHFSFPYGDAGSVGERDVAIAASLGLATAVTTHKDVLRHGNAMTGLPRVSLNGDFQKAHYVEVMLTGVPFKIFDTMQAGARFVRRLLSAGRQSSTKSPAPKAHPGVASI